MSTAHRVFNLLVKTGKGYTNDELVMKVLGGPVDDNSRATIRVAIRSIRMSGTPVVKKARYSKSTGKMIDSKYFIPVSQDITHLDECPRGRPSRAYAVPA